MDELRSENICIFCQVLGKEITPIQRHHIVYVDDQIEAIEKLCLGHHLLITAINRLAARQNGYKKLSFEERHLLWEWTLHCLAKAAGVEIFEYDWVPHLIAKATLRDWAGAFCKQEAYN